MNLDRARALADAVFLEGYCLYPYRATAPKNRNPYRWQFGVLAPRAWSEAGGCESWWMECQCLLHQARGIEGSLRFLRRVRRRVEQRRDSGEFTAVDSLDVAGDLVVSWDEAEVREVPISVGWASASTGVEIPFQLCAARRVELLSGRDGVSIGRVVRERGAVHGRVLVQAARAGKDESGLVHLSIRVECTTPWDDLEASRDQVLSGSCLSAHLLLGTPAGAFLSAQDPPGWAADATRECRSVRTYPVLVGEPGSGNLLLSAPIILYDHAQIAPQSQGDFFDATEIDELLTLRTQTLTADEKRLVRATDPRAAAILDRVESMEASAMERLHGVLRDEPDPVPAGIHVGARVRLCPGTRRTDAQDLLFAGATATIEKIMTDLDGQTCLAVTIDDDPAAELHRWYGRFHYYYLDEVELLVRQPSDEARS